MNWIQKRMAKGRSEEGFTLIELLLVIVVLGVLAGVVMFATGGVKDRGQLSACKTDVRNIATAQEAHLGTVGSYAADVNALIAANFLRGPDSGLHTTRASDGKIFKVSTGKCATPTDLNDGSDTATP